MKRAASGLLQISASAVRSPMMSATWSVVNLCATLLKPVVLLKPQSQTFCSRVKSSRDHMMSSGRAACLAEVDISLSMLNTKSYWVRTVLPTLEFGYLLHWLAYCALRFGYLWSATFAFGASILNLTSPDPHPHSLPHPLLASSLLLPHAARWMRFDCLPAAAGSSGI
jgi:hypothetical protein